MHYQPTHFRETRPEALHALIRRHPLATLVLQSEQGIEAEHIPVLLDTERHGQGVLRGHVARANPVWQQVAAGSEALAIFHGPDHYVSPGWYPSKHRHGRVVPTWNYVVVHARGTLDWQHGHDWLEGLVTDLTRAHEQTQRQPWQVSDAPRDYVERMLDAIVGFEIRLTNLTGKWKLSQNRDAGDIDGVIAAIQSAPAAGTEMVEMMSGEPRDERSL
jgi:transcriptional regulator